MAGSAPPAGLPDRRGVFDAGEGLSNPKDMTIPDDDPVLRQLHALWRGRAGHGGTLPTLSQIEEIELLHRPSMSLVEVTRDPPQYRYRWVSSEVAAMLGYDMTGKTTAAIPDAQARAYVERLYERALAQRAPLYEQGELVLGGRRLSYRTLVLPLSSDGSAIDKLLIYRRVR